MLGETNQTFQKHARTKSKPFATSSHPDTPKSISESSTVKVVIKFRNAWQAPSYRRSTRRRIGVRSSRRTGTKPPIGISLSLGSLVPVLLEPRTPIRRRVRRLYDGACQALRNLNDHLYSTLSEHAQKAVTSMHNFVFGPSATMYRQCDASKTNNESKNRFDNKCNNKFYICEDRL